VTQFDDLYNFVRESNRIEGIVRVPHQQELDATAAFVNLPALRASHVAQLVSVYQPGAQLRLRPGLNVRVGSHYPPPGGPNVGIMLEDLLARVTVGGPSPFEVHREYENLHPFTDGNGRSGRAIWLWQMLQAGSRRLDLGFLHAWYYQSLSAGH